MKYCLAFFGIFFFLYSGFISAENKWYKQESGTSGGFIDISFVDTLNGWVASNRWPIYHTSDAGRHWEPQAPDTPWSGGYPIGFKDSMEGWVGGYQYRWNMGGSGAFFYHTTDGGKSWTAQYNKKGNFVNIQFLVDIDISSSTCGFAIGHYSYSFPVACFRYVFPLFGTVRRNDSPSAASKICFLDSLNGWQVDKQRLFYTNIGPESLKVIDSFFNVNDFDFVDSLNGWAVADSGVIIHSINSGGTWVSETSGVTNKLTCVDFVDSLNGWVVGSGGCILRTRNGGQSWIAESSSTSINLSKVQFIDTSHGYAVGDSGTILYYGPFLAVEETGDNTMSRYGGAIQVFPNPFINTATVKFSAGNDWACLFKIYDVTGKLVGETDKTIIGKNLKPGIYFVKPGNSTPVKIVKISPLR